MSIFGPLLVLGVIGAILGLLLGFSAKKFAVVEDERVGKVRDVLPGANCGGCGFSGCDAYARAVVSGAPIDKCAPGGAPCMAKIAAILGREAAAMEPMIAWVACRGTAAVAKDWGDYMGIPDCRSASIIPGGGAKACQSGCMGYGTCVRACKFNALHIVNGIAEVDDEACVGCRACVEACPRNLISMIPKGSLVRIACNNPDKGPAVKSICSVGCIGCTICAKLSPDGAIVMEGNLPKVVNSKCEGCLNSVAKCPTKAICGYGPNVPPPKPEKKPTPPKPTSEKEPAPTTA